LIKYVNLKEIAQMSGEKKNGAVSGLTVRQQEIMTLVLRGMSNKEIARSLRISEGTVKIHLNSIYRRCDVTSRAKLFAKYFTGSPSVSQP
jgi:DNA-binding NarL/FixJ family response regulator